MRTLFTLTARYTPASTLMLTLAVIGIATAIVPGQAQACGGFFCNAQTQSPIFQSGERVIFVQGDEGQVTMHVEVSYAGEPTEFGWLIPILVDDTEPKALKDLMGLSSQDLFSALQARTNPSWTVQVGPDFPSRCDGIAQDSAASSGPSFGCAAINVLSADSASLLRETEVEPDEPRPDPYVQDSAKVGPYDAELIAAPGSSGDLFEWLGANGYNQDEAAKPLLAFYVSQGYKFIGVRLSNGLDTGDIRPLRLTLDEGGPCVPLRLTGIAATASMPIRVWVLGPGRAIPKNFIHGVVNQQAITYPNGGNYDSVVSDAVREAGGRAFITEMSEDASIVRGLLATNLPSDRRLAAMAEMSLTDFEAAWSSHGLPRIGADYAAVMAQFPLRPWEFTDTRLEWQKALVDQVARPKVEAQRLLDAAQHITRFYTRIDPASMTRDPIFGFNDELPDVPRDHTLVVRGFEGSDCRRSNILEWDDGRRFTDRGFSSGTFQVPNAPALLRAELTDETGDELPLHDNDILAIDAVLNNAALGVPTLDQSQRDQLLPAAEAEHWPNKPHDFEDQEAETSLDDDEGCAVSGSQVMLGYLAMTLAFLLGWRRRRRIEGTC